MFRRCRRMPLGIRGALADGRVKSLRGGVQWQSLGSGRDDWSFIIPLQEENAVRDILYITVQHGRSRGRSVCRSGRRWFPCTEDAVVDAPAHKDEWAGRETPCRVKKIGLSSMIFKSSPTAWTHRVGKAADNHRATDLSVRPGLPPSRGYAKDREYRVVGDSRRPCDHKRGDQHHHRAGMVFP